MEFELEIAACLNVLRDGGVILYPTDTVWGLGCDATNENAVARLYEIKERPPDLPMIILVTEEQDVLKHVAAPDLALFDYLKTTNHPTTVIYEGGIGVADNLLGSDGSVAIRICADPFCRHLIKRFGKPIVSTSANLHGEQSPSFFSDISLSILDQVDYAVSFRRDQPETSRSSTVIRWENGMPIVVRP
jgi:L-threonylcarbamoyladenylate synthase